MNNRYKITSFSIFLLLSVFLIVGVLNSAAFAQDDTPVLNKNEQKAKEKVDAVIKEIQRIRNIIFEKEQAGDQDGADEAKEELDEYHAKLNDAKIEALLEASEKEDLTREQIADMRLSGMGWGQIAHKLGVHPSVLGLGHKNLIQTMNSKKGKGKNKGNKGGGKGAGKKF
jgi:hypothetical protein